MRVIAGALRSRPLKAPPGDETRPTGARVREALFSILGDVSEHKVLDLYAGSGALGIEALSRGASAAVFVEASRPALICLRDNLTTLGLTRVATTLGRRAEGAELELGRHGPFDLVLCDPPWRDVEAGHGAEQALPRRAVCSRFAYRARARSKTAAAGGRSRLAPHFRRAALG